MPKVTLGARLRYAFDNSLSAGTVALIGWLGVVSLAVVTLAAALLTISGIKPDDGEALSFGEGLWQALMRAMDAGTVGGDNGWAFRAVMLVVTLGGLFIVGALISVLSSGLESKLEEFRKGRSFVVESGHTLILGWSPHVFLIISELVQANESEKKPRIVILADQDKVDMEDQIRDKVGDLKNTRVVCRSGSPIDLVDLEIVNPHEAKSIIILSPDEARDPDASVIKMILALTNNPNRRPEPYHIVAEIRNEKNMEAARMVGGTEAQLVLASELIARITAQTCRQTGLSVVYKELLDFGGDEIYFSEEPALVGRTYREALGAYETSALMGLRFADGSLTLNPPMDTIIQAGDKQIVIAEDDSAIKFMGVSEKTINEAAITNAAPAAPALERTLILGWNHRGANIVTELDNYVAPGSLIKIVTETADTEAIATELATNMKRATLEFALGDTTNRKLLDALEPATFDYVIVLCYADTDDPQDADSKTLLTLLHLRDIERIQGESYSVVSEMLDVRNRALAAVAKPDDFIVSDELTALMLSQVSENAELINVFHDLFTSEGSEIYLRPAADYITPGQPVDFYTILEAAGRRNETAIGYRLLSEVDAPDGAFGVRVNPAKSKQVTFGPEDKIIVLAEE